MRRDAVGGRERKREGGVCVAGREKNACKTAAAATAISPATGHVVVTALQSGYRVSELNDGGVQMRA